MNDKEEIIKNYIDMMKAENVTVTRNKGVEITTNFGDALFEMSDGLPFTYKGKLIDYHVLSKKDYRWKPELGLEMKSWYEELLEVKREIEKENSINE